MPVTSLGASAPEAPLPTGTELVVSVDPMGVICDGVPVEAVRVDEDLYLLDLSALGCSSLTTGRVVPGLLSPRAATPRGVALGGGELGGRGAAGRAVVVRRASGSWRLQVEGALSAPRAMIGRRAIRLRPVASSTRSAARELPDRTGTGLRTYQGAIGPRAARSGLAVSVRALTTEGAAVAAVVELG